jgi:serine protease Do
MRGSGSWIVGGVVLLIAGVLLGVIVTANYGWSPASVAREVTGSAEITSRYASVATKESPFVAVADHVLPAVVSVDTKRTIRRSADPFREMFREFFGERRYREYYGDEERYREFEVPGSASGFIFDPEGYILTNNHVVSGADEIEVTLSDGREFDATIVGQDPSTDVAVIRIEDGDRADLPTVNLGDSDEIRVGDWAIAIGNPLELAGTVTVGVISAVGRVDLNIRGSTPLYQDFIQTDASINFGNSGGPLVNIDGEVIGVNTAINPGASGIGFAIPVNLARNVAESLISEGKVVRGYLGVIPQEITPQLAEARGIEVDEGVIIASVEDGTPAEEAGLEPGDVVLRFAGVKIIDVPQFRRVVASVAPDRDVEVEILRDGRRRTLSAALAERPDTYAAEEEEQQRPREPAQWFGIDVVEVDDPLAEDLNIDADEGVLVVNIKGGSPAADGGLLVGDVIVKIGDEKVENLADYERIMKKVEKSDRAFALMVQRGPHTYFVAIEPEE